MERQEQSYQAEFKLPDNYYKHVESFGKNAPRLSGFKNQEILKVVPDFGEQDSKPPPPDQKISTEQILYQDFTTKGFQPDFLRPVP